MSRSEALTNKFSGAVWKAGRGVFSSRLAATGIAIVALLTLVALLAPWIAHGKPNLQNLSDRLQPPGQAHWFGTDNLGRDIFDRVVYASRITLLVVAAAAATVAPIGLLIGIAAGYFGGIVDAVLMRLTDIFMAFPRLVLALAFVAVLGPGIGNAILAIAITAWPPYARLARAETLTLRKREFVLAAKLQGASHARILARYILPLCISTILARLALDLAGMILIAAGLGFLGLGVKPPTAELGAMVAAGRDFIVDQWWLAAIPGAAIFLASLGFNLIGDGLRDVLDPRSETRR